MMLWMKHWTIRLVTATCRLIRAFTFRFDNHGTLQRRAVSGGSPRAPQGLARGVLGASGLSLCLLLSIHTAHSVDIHKTKNAPMKARVHTKLQVIDYQIYAFSQIRSYEQFDCLNKLYVRESQWNPLARNGNHYGIPQGNSRWLKGQSGYAQIKWGLAYIGSRYGYDMTHHVNACAALAHSYVHYWY